MSNIFRELCQEVLDYYEGRGKYNFTHLSHYDRDNAAFDSWQDIRQRIQSSLKDYAYSLPEVTPTSYEVARSYYTKGFEEAYKSVKEYVENAPMRPIHIDASPEILSKLNIDIPTPISLNKRNPYPNELDENGYCWFGAPPTCNYKLWCWDFKHTHSSRAEFETYFLPANVKCLPTL